MLSKDNESDISKIVVDAAYRVHTKLGPGLLESAYEHCLFYELFKRGLNVEKQKCLPLQYDDLIVEDGYKLDLVVENALIIELKNVEKLIPIHTAQILTYLKLSGIKIGLLINFNSPLIKDGIKRYAL
jgi:GxxExxY protein